MKLSPPARRLMLTTHVLVSVGWFGAVIAFLAVAVAGLSSADDRTVEGAYLAGAVMTWWVIVPLGLASLGTGLIQSWGTPWGLFKHYWVVAKLLLTVLATGVLLLHTGPIGRWRPPPPTTWWPHRSTNRCVCRWWSPRRPPQCSWP